MTDSWYNNDDLMKSIEDVEEKMDKVMIENIELKLRVADVNSKIDFLTKLVEMNSNITAYDTLNKNLVSVK